MRSDRPISILFVCLGNICRSPLAEGVFRHQVEQAGRAHQFVLDSCGTGAWHVGNPPDQRSIQVATKHGIDLTDLRARKISVEDFYAFDLILAMDRDNLANLRAMQPRDGHAEVALYLDYCGIDNRLSDHEVPDPYYGGISGFDDVYDMIAQAGSNLLARHQAE